MSLLDQALLPNGVPDEPGEDDRPGHLQLAVRNLHHDQYAARAAREFTSTSLRAWALEHLIGDTAVVVSELVTNAVRHGVDDADDADDADDPASVRSAEPVKVMICRTERSVVCAVTDPSPRGPQLRDPDYEAENGRGLQVIQGISHTWGWSPLQTRGKAVWAAFTISPSSPARERRLEPCP
ncbi:hypothetical protein GCM10010156_47850 [Planobispora rosea]|uniref:Histidine kinase/HSP90-like ATPase domain-containing protein n=1 Tax=Planobispora rosea TaxID=35762 RepID=A0A8J3S3U7_PLARO|nr:hypothetical protein GCM10010156_47850 [Planobispora rosea]GIH86324.1 hypothetical protein Pro02_47320 [Planobispora rosea]